MTPTLTPQTCFHPQPCLPRLRPLARCQWMAMLFGLAPLILSGNAGSAAEVTVRTSAALVAELARAKPGDEILLAPGQYDSWEATLQGQGSAKAPIVIRPAQPHSVTFTGATQIRAQGKFVEFRGFVFQGVTTKRGGGVFFFDGSSNCRLTDCDFISARMEYGGTLVWFLQGAADNRVDHCRFRDTQHRCIKVHTNDAHTRRVGPPLRNRIDHNLFIDGPALKANGGETIQLGNGAYPLSLVEPLTLIEDNEFIRCNGEIEIISGKSGGNTIRRNRFIDCAGEVVMRSGNNGVIEDNLLIDCTGGIRLSGHGHQVRRNTIVRPRTFGIVLYYGTPDPAHPAAYPAVHDCLIENNLIVDAREWAILIGRNRNKSWPSQPPTPSRPEGVAAMITSVAPKNNVIRNNTLIGTTDNFIEQDESPDNQLENNTLLTRPAR
ncbi:chondroitinase-B domain-containing protein [Planctomicrobium sp. SH664]|uniref:polysaccharide lyase 6 family protein n=1 Tax=Planctomicrobium sp. SH664 TaxID=3448125 RepID=UPI003F5B9C50